MFMYYDTQQFICYWYREKYLIFTYLEKYLEFEVSIRICIFNKLS